MFDHRLLPPLFALGALVFAPEAAGRANRFLVEAYCAEPNGAPPFSYTLKAGAIPPVCDDLEVEVAKDRLRAALAAKGMFEAPAGVRPEVEIEFSVAMWEQILPDRNLFLRFRPVTSREQIGIRTVVTDDGRTERVRERIQAPTGHGLGPAQSLVRQRRLYEKHLSVRARRLADEEPAAELWRVQVVTRDAREEMSASFPRLVSAAMDAIATRNEGRAEIVLARDDARVRFVTSTP